MGSACQPSCPPSDRRHAIVVRCCRAPVVWFRHDNKMNKQGRVVRYRSALLPPQTALYAGRIRALGISGLPDGDYPVVRCAGMVMPTPPSYLPSNDRLLPSSIRSRTSLRCPLNFGGPPLARKPPRVETLSLSANIEGERRKPFMIGHHIGQFRYANVT